MKVDHLVCPYNECGREFERPVVLTDFSKTPRETYYACPHCLTRVDVVVGDSGVGSGVGSVSVRGSEGFVGKPMECGRFFGYLKTLSRDASVPDECLTCPRLLQCFVKKEP